MNIYIYIYIHMYMTYTCIYTYLAFKVLEETKIRNITRLK